MNPPKVLVVGQCGYDYSMLAELLRSCGAAPAPAEDADEALQQLAAGGFALVLINRVLAGDGSGGVELVERIRKDAQAATPTMLISNYLEAQQAAVAKGALPGFGKSELHDPKLRERLLALFAAANS